jgi:hypothetical protein
MDQNDPTSAGRTSAKFTLPFAAKAVAGGLRRALEWLNPIPPRLFPSDF